MKKDSGILFFFTSMKFICKYLKIMIIFLPLSIHFRVVEQLIRLFTPMALSCQSSTATNLNSTNSTQNDIFFLLEELWRSALLAPPIPKRVEAIRLIKRLCAMPTAFGELLQLTAASGTDSFWLLMVECLEECCCHGSADQQQQKLAMEALRTLNALVGIFWGID
jgi:hypothetical protein